VGSLPDFYESILSTGNVFNLLPVLVSAWGAWAALSILADTSAVVLEHLGIDDDDRGDVL